MAVPKESFGFETHHDFWGITRQSEQDISRDETLLHLVEEANTMGEATGRRVVFNPAIRLREHQLPCWMVGAKELVTMRDSVRWASWVSVLTVGLLFSGCDLLESDLGLDVSVTVNPTVFAIHDSTEIIVRVHNVSSVERTVTGGGCLVDFHVFDSAGDFAAPYIVCGGALFHVSIPRYGTVEYKFFWDGLAGNTDPEWLSPGRYTVTGVLDSYEVVIHSTPVTIDLLPPS